MKLGIIGMSEGNGHPYSWSAIFNGYDTEAMEECGFPVIPRYLERQNWPDCQIDGAEVTSIWTQDLDQSRHIAKASKISKVAISLTELIDSVDAVLLARDDAENHMSFAIPVLNAGLPIYIDKPIALSTATLELLYSHEKFAGQIFTCSALRYSSDLILLESDRNSLGDVRKIVAFTPKSWRKYAVHIIEPVLNMLPPGDTPVEFIKLSSANGALDSDSRGLQVRWQSGIETAFFATGSAMTPISIRVMGSLGWKDLIFDDTFSAFKSSLEAFKHGVEKGTVESPRDFNTQVVKLIEMGL